MGRLSFRLMVQSSDSGNRCRTIIDLLFCDLLDRLENGDAFKNLNWYPEVRMSITDKSSDTHIHSRADWCLAYGPNNKIDTALIVLEANESGEKSGFPQLIVYLAAAQDRRKQSGKIAPYTGF